MRSRHVVFALVLLLSLHSGVARAFTDAEIVALKLSGRLLAPPEMVAQVAADLDAVRAYDAYFESIHVLLDWLPGELYVQLTPDAWDLFQAGQYHGLDALDSQYGPVQIAVSSPTSRVLRLSFSQAYNAALLGAIYGTADGVASADPVFWFAGGDNIVASSIGSYRFEHGWGDCPSGCLSRHYWSLEVTDGVAQLVGEGGDPFGACCASDGCQMAEPSRCASRFVGGLCHSAPCATPTRPEEWGELKVRYR